LFTNSNALPGMMFIGALAMPFTVLVFMYEVNVPRDIGFYDILRMFLLAEPHR